MKNTLRFFKKITPMLALAAMIMAPSWGWGQTVNIAAGETKTEDFTIGTNATAALPTGWKADKNANVRSVGSYDNAGTATERRDGDNMSNSASNGLYNYGAGPAATATDRAVGGLSSSSASKSVNIYVQLTNNGTSTINDFTISYAVEKYRNGINSAGFSIQMYYSTDGETWTSAGSDFLTSFASDINNEGYASAPGSIVNVLSKTLGQAVAASNSLFLAWNYSVTSGSTTSNAQALGIDDVVITANGGAASPLISITPSSLLGFEYVQGSGPSTEQTFTVSGSDLTANISIAASTNYEISKTSGSGYATPLTFTPAEAATPQTVYVRLKAGLSVGDYNGEEITATSTGAADKTVSCSGSVTAPPDPEPTNHATAFAATVATPAYSAVDVTWADATGGTVPDGYVIKASTVSYAAIAEPVDGAEETEGTLVKIVAPGVQSASFTGLDANTTYYFKIWPYTNSGTEIDYKTDGTVPQDEATTAVAPPVPAIYFSEYIEGSSNNKALEIYNGTGSSIDLSLLTVNNYANGSATASNTYTGAGTLNQGATFVIGNADAAAGIASKADVTSTVTYFNGDDAVELVYDGQTIDIIGIIGERPTTGWNVAGVSTATANHTLIRKLNVTTGNTNWAISAGTDVNDSEWVVKDIDYFENLSFVGTVWQGVSTDWTAEANWDMGVPSIYQAWVVPATEAPVVSTTETVSDVIVLGNDLHISPTGFLTVNNLLGIVEPGMVTVEPLGKLSGEVINFGTADLMVIQSDATGTGSVITDWNSQATIQRYLTGGWDGWDAGWHQLSSPVAAQPIADFATTGVGNDYDFYGWDEPTNMWMNYKDGGFSTWNGGTNFNVGQGYLVSYEAANTTQTFIGELNVANVTKTDLTTNGGSFNGWHLLGNPFASALTWNDGNWALSNVAGNAKIWHEANKSYSDIASNGIIPSAQGFMVQVSSATNSITIPTVSRVHDAQPFYKSGNTQLLLVAAETEGGSAQESKIMVNPMATEGFDFDYDSRFLAGYAPAFYSVAGEELLSTNSFPSIDAGLVIPFGFVKNAASTFSIQLKESMEGRVVYLTDTKTGTVSNLTETPVYSFTSDEGDDDNRFTLSFGSLGINDPETTDGVQVYSNGEVLYIGMSSKEAALVNVYNLTGQLVMQGKISGNTLSTLNASALGNGIYMVNVVMGNQVVRRKVAIRN